MTIDPIRRLFMTGLALSAGMHGHPAGLAAQGLPASPAQAGAAEDCSINVDPRPSLWLAPIDSDAVMPIDIAITVDGDCRASLSIDNPIVPLTGQGGSIDAHIMTGPRVFSAQAISIPLSPGTLQLFWRPNARGKAGAGVFQGSVPMRIVDGSGDTIATAFMDLGLEVDAELSVAMQGGSDRSMDIDFGDLRAGSDRTVGFDVSSNSAFSVETVSASGGFLVHTIADIAVPYTASLRSRGLGGHPSAGRFEAGEGSIFIDLLVPVSPDAPAGNYKDELTVIFRSEL